MSTAPRDIDFIARLAASWDRRGNDVLMVYEQRALWQIAGLELWPESELAPYWRELEPDQRQRLVLAARKCMDLAEVLRRAFGG